MTSCQHEPPPTVYRGLELEVVEELAPGVTLVRNRYEEMVHLSAARQEQLPTGFLPARHDRAWMTTSSEIDMVRRLFT